MKGDRLYVAPRDSPHLLALDATDGRVLWLADAADPEAEIAGVAGDTLVVAGRRVFGYDAATGRRRMVWPESEHAGVRGIGRGVLVGNTFCWPTRDEVFFFDPTVGGFNRPPISLDPVSVEGANLAVSGQNLVIAGPEQIGVLGERPAAESAELAPELARLLEGDDAEAVGDSGLARR